MMTAPIFCAMRSATADLPDAVGPHITMNLRATIIADPVKKNLSQEIIESFADSCEDLTKIEVTQAGWLANIYFNGNHGTAPVDCDLIVRPATLDFKLLICDMESTIIDNEFLDEIADHLGIGEQVANITKRAMNGELGFEESMHERIELVKDVSRETLLQLTKDRLAYNEGAKELIQGCNAKGIHTMLVSGGFTLFTEIVANELGFKEHFANELIFENEKLVGVQEPILGKESKLEILQKRSAEMRIDISQAITMGDGANDLPMLKAAGLGIAYRAKPLVKEEISNQFNIANLDGVLNLL